MKLIKMESPSSSSVRSVGIMNIGINCVIIMMVALVLMMLGKTVNWVYVKPKRKERILREQGFKGNSYSFLFGDYKAMAMAIKEATSKPIKLTDDILPRALPFHHLIYKIYGKYSLIWFGSRPRVNMMNPEDIKNVVNKMSEFPKPRNSPLARYLLSGLVAIEDEEWAKHRKIINPAFHLHKLKLVLPAMYESCKEMIKEWKRMMNEKGELELDVYPFLNSLSGEVISRTAFGSSFQEGITVFQLQNEQAQLTAKALRSLYIPGWRFVPTKMNRRMKEIDNEMQVLLRGIIDKREEAMKKGETGNDDLLGLLLESNKKEIKEHGNKSNMGMSTQDVINECKLFYLAGQETTSALLNWTIVLLSKFPHWQEKARQEVNQVFGSNKIPHYEGLNCLKVVSMILYEVLRLYPPIPSIVREVRKEAVVGKMRLPEGTQITIPTALIHQDPEMWGEDAKEFKPERFSEGISKATKGESIYLPFGGGPRICIGQHFALLEAKMALSLILQNFTFHLSPSYSHAPIMFLTLQPQHGTHIVLHKL